MKTRVSCIILFSLVLITCGCTAHSPFAGTPDSSVFAEKVKASQRYYDDLVRADPSNSTAWTLRGMYYNNAFGQYETALQSYDRALELDPENGLAYYARGVTLQNMHRLNKSQNCFENAKKHGFDTLSRK